MYADGRAEFSGNLELFRDAPSNGSILGEIDFINTFDNGFATSVGTPRAQIVAKRQSGTWGSYLEFSTSTGDDAIAVAQTIFPDGNVEFANNVGVAGEGRFSADSTPPVNTTGTKKTTKALLSVA